MGFCRVICRICKLCLRLLLLVVVLFCCNLFCVVFVLFSSCCCRFVLFRFPLLRSQPRNTIQSHIAVGESVAFNGKWCQGPFQGMVFPARYAKHRTPGWFNTLGRSTMWLICFTGNAHCRRIQLWSWQPWTITPMTPCWATQPGVASLAGCKDAHGGPQKPGLQGKSKPITHCTSVRNSSLTPTHVRNQVQLFLRHKVSEYNCNSLHIALVWPLCAREAREAGCCKPTR